MQDFRVCRTTPPASLQLIESRKHAEIFRGWHWFHRFKTAARECKDFPHLAWIMSRVRLREVLSAPFPAGNTGIVLSSEDTGSNVSIGQVFRSEIGVATILRIHVNRPSWILGGTRKQMMLPRALKYLQQHSVGTMGKPVEQWGSAAEKTLLKCIEDELLAKAPRPPKTRDGSLYDNIVKFRTTKILEIRQLSTEPTFALYDDGLPPQPAPPQPPQEASNE